MRSIARFDGVRSPIGRRNLSINFQSALAPCCSGWREPPSVGSTKPEELETAGELTDCELSVLRLIFDGRSNPEATAHLKIGEETVKHHVKRAMRKLKARERTHAVAEAMRHGLMS
jgi:DNA-binding NarL/FixJ family response regulator